MKLLLITAVQEYKENVKKILLHSGIKTFTYMPAKGYRDSTMDSIGNNWFGSEMNESEAFVYFVFATEETISPVRQAIEDFNKKSESLSAIHLAVMELTSIH